MNTEKVGDKTGTDFKFPETEISSLPKKSGIFDMRQLEDGSVEVQMPNNKRGYILGLGYTGTEFNPTFFASAEEAETAIEDEKKKAQDLKELISLYQIRKDHLFDIQLLSQDHYRVVTPGLKSMDGNFYIGTYTQEFDSWETARTSLQEYLERESELAKNPILEVSIDDSTKIAFSDLKAYNPKVAPTNKEVSVPEKVKELMFPDDMRTDITNVGTYTETIKNPNWDEEIYKFIQDYLAKEGSEIVETYGIKDLTALTPKQAVMLATAIVVELTKYDHNQTNKNMAVVDGEPEKTKSDKSSVIDLLKDGRQNKDNPTWQGNGVCRNFAVMLKMVFDCLKANQTEFSQLNGTFATYQSGRDEFKPKREIDTTSMDFSGHAWNTFVTVSPHGSANSTIVDATWGRQNLETHEVERVDYTLTRMEPIVHKLAESFGTDRSSEVRKVIEYYNLRANTPGQSGGFSSAAEQTEFFVSQAMKLVRKNGSSVVPPEFAAFALREYQILAKEKRVTRDDLEGLAKLWQADSVLDIRPVLDRYIENHPILNEYAVVQGDYFLNDPQLIEYVLLKFAQKPGFEEIINNNPSVRHLVRTIAPQLLNENEAADNNELYSRMRNMDEFRYSVSSPEKARDVIASIRHNWQKRNPEVYNKLAAGLDNFQLIAQYGTIKKAIGERED